MLVSSKEPYTFRSSARISLASKDVGGLFSDKGKACFSVSEIKTAFECKDGVGMWKQE